MDAIKVFQRREGCKILVGFTISLGLLGCGGGDSNSSSFPEPTPPVSDTSYYAQDAVRHSSPVAQFYVDLSNSMESSDGSLVSLTAVTPLTSDNMCDVISQDSKGFTIKANSTKVCDFRYRVGASMIPKAGAVKGEGYAEATVRTAVGATTESLVPLSSTTSTSTSVMIDIVSLLGLNSYTLDTDQYTLSVNIVLPNENKTNSTAIADVANNTIEYTPGSGIPSGVERILYSYSDGESLLTGTIDVAVSTDANNAPTADSAFITEYKDSVSGKTVSKIPYGQAALVDVASLIADTDGDTLQLVDVFSYDATLSIPEDANNDGNNFNDTVFEFAKTDSGVTNVTYVVSDGKGGYATGVVQLLVDDAYSDIVLDTATPKLVYFAPLTAQAADQANIIHSSESGDGVSSILDLSIATLDWNIAKAYCEATGGQLPTVNDLEALNTFVNQGGGLFEGYQWPQNTAYWTSSDGTTVGNKKAYNFGSESILNDEGLSQTYYTTCVSTYTLSREILGDSVLKPNPDTVPSETPLPDEIYHYQIQETRAGTTKIVDDSEVTWTNIGSLPHYVNFDRNTGVLKLKTSEILPEDKNVSFSIQGCIGADCYPQSVSILLPWNRILSNGGYEYSPLLTVEEKAALGGASMVWEDPTNYTYTVKDSSILGKEWLELNVNDAVAYCDSLTFDGGGWKAWSDRDQASSYFEILLEMANLHTPEGSTADVMIDALNIAFERNQGAPFRMSVYSTAVPGIAYSAIFLGEAPNIYMMGAVGEADYSGYDFKGAEDQHMLGVCYRDAK